MKTPERETTTKSRTENAQRTINNAIAFLSSLVSGTFRFAFAPSPPLRTAASSSSKSSDSSPYPFPKPSRDDARSSPASRPISTSSTELDTLSSASALCRLAAACTICRSSSWAKRKEYWREERVRLGDDFLSGAVVAYFVLVLKRQPGAS